jgi:hypothetical protein
MKTKNYFSVYRNNILIDSKLDQVKAHKVAREDAKKEFSQGRTPTYVLKGTFADGKNETKIGTFKHGRIYWKFAKN